MWRFYADLCVQGVGFSLGTMGWGEGFGLYTLFGLFAGM